MPAQLLAYGQKGCIMFELRLLRVPDVLRFESLLILGFIAVERLQ
ncbi:MAG: hypothetical protein HPY66_1077 [Firmicutes bacterium]|nr:hypothetical protein [Bacillota bacterium]